MNQNSFLYVIAFLLLLTGCTKSADLFVPDATSYSTYIIKKGEHYSSGNQLKAIETSQLKFFVRFDSSAIYQTASAENQYDINKLYGFSDNDAGHHQYSARIGWRWSDNALRLFAYVYNEGVVSSKEITAVAIGEEVSCSIVASSVSYIFKVNETTQIIPRKATTVKAKGYQLYPYFGGDETAPHEIVIRIKEDKLP